MIAITMIGGINCGVDDAEAIVEFLLPFKQHDVRVNIDLIPYNDIGMDGLQRPSDLEIQAFKVKQQLSCLCYLTIVFGDYDRDYDDDDRDYDGDADADER